MAVWQFSIFKLNAEGGIRTHEANARDLKTRPFDHSGTPAERLTINSYALFLWATRAVSITAPGGFRSHDLVLIVDWMKIAVSQSWIILSLSAESGIRTHEANARDLKTRPFDHSGTPADD